MQRLNAVIRSCFKQKKKKENGWNKKNTRRKIYKEKNKINEIENISTSPFCEEITLSSWTSKDEIFAGFASYKKNKT